MWRTRVGYAGGSTPDPTYRSIGDHTECFQVDFDPHVVSYEELLDLALTSHDPTRRAFKEQYASLILARDGAQVVTARAVAQRFEARLGHQLATRIEPLTRFYLAEDYHQKYFLRNDRVLMADFLAMFGQDGDVFRESAAAARVNGYVAGNGSASMLGADIELLGLGAAGRAHLEEAVGRGIGGGSGCSI